MLTVLPGLAVALSSDRDQPIEIEANRAEADESQRVTIYKGDAVITQGTLRISGETIWIYLNAEDEFVKLVSVGRPAQMRQIPDGETEPQVADAKRLEYYADRDLIVLLGNARYGQGQDRISAERIEYDSRRGRMRAVAQRGGAGGQSGSDQGTGRVRITISPKSQKKAE
ncbi:MAG: lipopolysaccharide transport periplasmic protein LptA [Ectothiorhodospiraceae bacterium]|nr:lipopolysaccharide transport periplasmic protein LptA [Chromatiales bacterium]MCP5157586.1 lipopolysaccharide transport periplasmic protein LptA [Ectothiorhodospiraceae bacterium]